LGGLWEFPGGKQEPTESLEDCLTREILEELALKISIKNHLFTIEHSYPEANISLHLFLCETDSVTPQCRDVQAWKWIKIEQLKNFHFTEADQKLVERIAEYLVK